VFGTRHKAIKVIRAKHTRLLKVSNNFNVPRVNANTYSVIIANIHVYGWITSVFNKPI